MTLYLGEIFYLTLWNWN